MKRYFNTEGICEPDIHYMVNLDDRLRKIRQQYVDRGKYFVINRGRQYGKTTTLAGLAEYLKDDYNVLQMDFQKLGASNFKDEISFVKAFSKAVLKLFHGFQVEDRECLMEMIENSRILQGEGHLDEMFLQISKICETVKRPVVLMIDEVDAASDYQVFLDFLSMLRGYYLDRKNSSTFWSVILAGVYDIKNLKLKLRPQEEHKYNSPWNIAAEFDMNMSFSSFQIADMLDEYAKDNHIAMDSNAMAEEIFQYTSGYPYLVSAICKIMDEKLPESELFADPRHIWSKEGVSHAVHLLLQKNIPLFESMTRQLYGHPDMKQMLYAILFQGKKISYNADHPVISLAAMFGYIINFQGSIQVANRIFETRLYNFFLSEEELTNAIYDKAQGDIGQFIRNGRLDMEKVLEKFVEYFTEIYGDNDGKFVEEYGRKFFLLFLKPIINGTGNYYIEARTRDARRTDVVVDYRGEQFIIELKIWHGSEYNGRGEKQLSGYLDDYRQKKGYMISFNFNRNKKTGVQRIQAGDKTIIEAVV